MGNLARRLGRRNLADGLVLVLSFWVAYLFRFEFVVPAEYIRPVLVMTPILVAIQMTALRHYSVHRVMGRFFSYEDLFALAWAAAWWLMPMMAVRLLAPSGPWRIPISVALIDTMLLVGGIAGIRLAQRYYAEVWSVRASRPTVTKPVLLVGAGEAGAKVARELTHSHSELQVVGFVDDDAEKHRALVSAVPVLGSPEDIPDLVEQHDIDHVIITIADRRPAFMERIVTICGTVPIRARAIPNFLEIVEGTKEITSLRDVGVDDLLGRDQVDLETQAQVVDLLRGRVVMVTGAGGSIGSELARQAAGVDPKLLLLVERFEGSLFEIHRELERTLPEVATVPLVADITDEARMRHIFDEYRPDVVVHAAAHKHVAMMEDNPGEAIKNNIFGTKLVAEMAAEYGTKTFVLVSTDKAVRPTSIMGASKRLAEMVVQHCNDIYEDTKFVAVRFGNVLGSSGSVIPIFKEQVARGGPVTVRHPEATRFFMTIPEASRLVLTAGAIGQGGEVMVLDMGQPVRIIDLARNLIRLSGYVPDRDIEIKITGLKPGEKLNEELYSDTEQMELTRHPKIFVGHAGGHSDTAGILFDLAACIDSTEPDQVREAFRLIVKRSPQPWGLMIPPQASVPASRRDPNDGE